MSGTIQYHCPETDEPLSASVSEETEEKWKCPSCGLVLEDEPPMVLECSSDECGERWAAEERENCQACNRAFVRILTKQGCPDCADETEVEQVQAFECPECSEYHTLEEAQGEAPKPNPGEKAKPKQTFLQRLQKPLGKSFSSQIRIQRQHLPKDPDYNNTGPEQFLEVNVGDYGGERKASRLRVYPGSDRPENPKTVRVTVEEFEGGEHRGIAYSGDAITKGGKWTMVSEQSGLPSKVVAPVLTKLYSENHLTTFLQAMRDLAREPEGTMPMVPYFHDLLPVLKESGYQYKLNEKGQLSIHLLPPKVGVCKAVDRKGKPYERPTETAPFYISFDNFSNVFREVSYVQVMPHYRYWGEEHRIMENQYFDPNDFFEAMRSIPKGLDADGLVAYFRQHPKARTEKEQHALWDRERKEKDAIRRKKDEAEAEENERWKKAGQEARAAGPMRP